MDIRKYDPAIARWTGIDPVTHHSLSPYNAFDNNPVYWADPSGANSTQQWMEENGITDDDLITIYQAPSEDNSDENSNDCCGGKSAVGAYKHKESPKESNYYDNNRGVRKVVRNAAFDAGVLATKVSGDLGGDNLGYSGAIRHSYWMYLIAVELSPEIAEVIGTLHEDFVIGKGKDNGKHNFRTDDGKMDLANNAWGINLARNNPGLSELEFEELFFNEVSNNNTSLIILDSSTIPSQTLRKTIEYRSNRHKEVKQEMKATEHLRLPSIKF